MIALQKIPSHVTHGFSLSARIMPLPDRNRNHIPKSTQRPTAAAARRPEFRVVQWVNLASSSPMARTTTPSTTRKKTAVVNQNVQIAAVRCPPNGVLASLRFCTWAMMTPMIGVKMSVRPPSIQPQTMAAQMFGCNPVDGALLFDIDDRATCLYVTLADQAAFVKANHD